MTRDSTLQSMTFEMKGINDRFTIGPMTPHSWESVVT